jgi:hypothetical protein
MHFTKIFASAVALCASVSTAVLTAPDVIVNINALTTKSQALQSPAQSISIINGPLIVIGQGPFPVSRFLSHPCSFSDLILENHLWLPRHHYNCHGRHCSHESKLINAIPNLESSDS